MNSEVEVGIVAHVGGEMPHTVLRAVQKTAADSFDALPVRPFRIKKVRKLYSQGLPRRRTKGEEVIQVP